MSIQIGSYLHRQGQLHLCIVFACRMSFDISPFSSIGLMHKANRSCANIQIIQLAVCSLTPCYTLFRSADLFAAKDTEQKILRHLASLVQGLRGNWTKRP